MMLWIRLRNKAAFEPVEGSLVSTSRQYSFISLLQSCLNSFFQANKWSISNFTVEIRSLPAHRNWFFHHDNIPVQTVQSVKQFLFKNGMTSTVHPPYSPDLVPFFLFPRLKRNKKEHCFETIKEVTQK